jgi:hypothetical protein
MMRTLTYAERRQRRFQRTVGLNRAVFLQVASRSITRTVFQARHVHVITVSSRVPSSSRTCYGSWLTALWVSITKGD